MPQVGNKHFAYTGKGRAAAKAESARTGKPIKTYRKGGSLLCAIAKGKRK